jgi:flagellar basal body-associated protein FliL
MSKTVKIIVAIVVVLVAVAVGFAIFKPAAQQEQTAQSKEAQSFLEQFPNKINVFEA